jgi:hypothetical protein
MQRWLLAKSLAIIAASAGAQTPAAPEPPKFARVSGVVIDAQDGRLLRRAIVCLHRGADRGYPNSGDCNETDAQGRFKIVNLPPARYVYSLEREGYFQTEPTADGLSSFIALNAGDDLSGLKLHMRRLGSIVGRVVFEDGEPFPGASVSLSGSGIGHERTGDNGEYRLGNLPPGDYRVLVDQPYVPDCDNFSGRQPRLYINRTASLDTRPIHVDAGQEVNGPEIVMVEAKPHRVTGRIVWDNYPLGGLWTVSSGNNGVRPRDSDGAFAICGLVPGEYTLRVNDGTNGRKAAGEVKIRIEDEDLKDLEIVPEVSATIHARIEVEDNVPLDLANTNLFGFPGPFPHESVPQARRQPDGSFLIEEVYTGEYRFELGPLPPGTYLKSARINGQDVIDAPLLVHAGENLEGLVFTVSPKAARLTGVVQDETGQPVPNAPVAMLPDPKHVDVDVHRCFPQTDQNGGFECEGLAPGKYRIAAWRTTSGFPDAWDEVSTKGAQVELQESGRASITLTVPKQ